jgi:pyrroline-5-carboxylate reductase
MDQKLLLVGCGKMGGALLGGWLGRDVKPDAVTVIEPFDTGTLEQKFGVTALKEVAELDNTYHPDVVVFAVKPQGMETIVPDYVRFVRPATVFLSIAAGRPIAFFEKHLGGSAAVVRSMPNTPAAVGRGISVACGNAHMSDDQRAICQTLLEAVGEVAWVDDESLLDPVTAVSGSGPAYVFLLIETLAQAGVVAGLEPALAQKLARATVTGSGELAHLSSDTATTLRENVTSPGGTTAAALDVLMAADGLQELMTRAVDAATKRSRELAG